MRSIKDQGIVMHLFTDNTAMYSNYLFRLLIYCLSISTLIFIFGFASVDLHHSLTVRINPSREILELNQLDIRKEAYSPDSLIQHNKLKRYNGNLDFRNIQDRIQDKSQHERNSKYVSQTTSHRDLTVKFNANDNSGKLKPSEDIWQSLFKKSNLSAALKNNSVINDRLHLLKTVISLFKNLNVSRVGTVLPNKTSDCEFLYQEWQFQKHSYQGVWESTTQYDNVSNITLVTQFIWRRLWIFSHLLDHWTGPVSAAIYVEMEHLDTFMRHVADMSNMMLRKNLDIHLVLANGTYYPINLLRNLALNNAQTTYVLLNDVDFIPSKGLQEGVMKVVNDKMLFNDNQQVLVIPAMEFVAYTGNVFPKNKDDLKLLLDEELVVTSESIHWTPGHQATNYSHWMDATELYEIKYEIDYEPYIIGKKSAIPLYNESFLAGHRDKSSHFLSINAKGLQFMVHPEHFVLHYPHSKPKPNKYLYYCSCTLYADLMRQYGFYKQADELDPKKTSVESVLSKMFKFILRQGVF